MRTVLTFLIVVGLLMSIIPVNHVKAESMTFPTFIMQNTKISATFTYPESIYWEDELSLPVSISVIFENQSIEYLSIWKTRVRIVEKDANPTPLDPDTLDTYAFAGELATDPIFEPLYLTENPEQINFVARIAFNVTDFSWVSTLQSSVEAKIYLEISLTLVDSEGKRYSRTGFTTPDQLPTVTIQSHGGTNPPSDSTFPLSSVAFIVVIVAVCLLAIFVIFKWKKKS